MLDGCERSVQTVLNCIDAMVILIDSTYHPWERDTMLWNLQQLRVFVLTVETQKLGLVARKLGIRQPTVSFHLKRLEQDLGQSVFERSGRSTFELTSFGKSIYRYAKRMVSTEDEATHWMEDHRLLRRGRIRIGSTYTPATYIFPRHIARFKEFYPDIDFDLQVAGANILLERLRSFQLDACILSHFQLDDDDLLSTPIMDDDLRLIASRDHEAARVESLDKRTIAGWEVVMHESGSISRYMMDTWAQRHGVKLHVVLEVSATETMKELVKHGVGIAFVSQICCQQDVAAGHLISRPIPDFAFRRRIYLVQRKEPYPSNALQALQSVLLTESNDTDITGVNSDWGKTV